jgi:sec-independent protein translocase protein TatA
MTTNFLAQFFSMPSGGEWLVVGLVALLLFGRRLPEVARSLGQSVVAFKKGLKEVTEDINKEAQLPPPTPPVAPKE